MSKEVRHVIPNWEHPKQGKWVGSGWEKVYNPLRDRCVQEAFDEWLEEYQEWCESGMAVAMSEDPGFKYPNQPFRSFCDRVRSAIDPEKYRPSWNEEDATWLQVYETVSEGTPLTPPFATADELIDYLVNNGDFWGDRWSKEAATNFVKHQQWQPSAAILNGVPINLSKEVI